MTDKERVHELEAVLRVIRTWVACDVTDRNSYVVKVDHILKLIDKVLPRQLNEVPGVKRRSGERGDI